MLKFVKIFCATVGDFVTKCIVNQRLDGKVCQKQGVIQGTDEMTNDEMANDPPSFAGGYGG